MKRTGDYLVNQAIIPAAGVGARMLPITKALPKEMLPIGRKPVIQYILEELASAGVTKALIIVSDGKEMIEKYFGDGRNLGLRCEYLLQRQMKGSGNAILEAESWTDHKPFVVAWGDCISTVKPQNTQAELPVPLARLIHTFDLLRPDFAVLAKRLRGIKAATPRRLRYTLLPRQQTLTDAAPAKPFDLLEISKHLGLDPIPDNSIVTAARWILSEGIFPFLRMLRDQSQEEILLTEAARLWLNVGARARAVPLLDQESIEDMGTWKSYLNASARYATLDPEYDPSP